MSFAAAHAVPGTATAQAGGAGDVQWTNPNNVKVATDAAAATVVLAGSETSKALDVTGFPTSTYMPPGATVTGATVLVRAKEVGTGDTKFAKVSTLLDDAAAVVGTDLFWWCKLTGAPTSTALTSAYQTFVAGWPAAPWGIFPELNGTTADWNHANVGYRLRFENLDAVNAITVSVAWIQLRFHWRNPHKRICVPGRPVIEIGGKQYAL